MICLLLYNKRVSPLTLPMFKTRPKQSRVGVCWSYIQIVHPLLNVTDRDIYSHNAMSIEASYMVHIRVTYYSGVTTTEQFVLCKMV